MKTLIADLTKNAWARIVDLAPGFLRTAVPVWWGALTGWALTYMTWQPVVELVQSVDPVALAGLVTVAWYAIARWVEPRLSDWATRLVLGSAKVPAYDAVAVQSPEGAVAGPGSLAPDGTPVAVLVVAEGAITDAGQA